MKNTLYFGDNLDVLRRYVADESVDLVYLDPPFNSDQSYNVLFQEQDGSRSAAQIRAFEDTWQWDQGAAAAYQEVVEGGGQVSLAMQAFHTVLGMGDMLAYLSMMAPRLKELNRVLKPAGSIYLHCDPTASHYLKMLMDAIFLVSNFRNEVVWRRTTGRKSGRQYGRVHDVLLFYSKSSQSTWNAPTVPHDIDNLRGHDIARDEDGTPYRLSDLSGAGQGPPRAAFGDRGEIAPPSGRHWQFDQEGIDKLLIAGRIVFSAGGSPRLRTRIADLPGIAVTDLWADIEPINSAAAERVGYPTQKPEALLDRIITASSNEGDTVLDPFCGCGTAIAAAQKLNRRWIGIDVTSLAITLIKHRLHNAFGDSIRATYDIVGEPVSEPDARALAETDPYQFQWWALGLVNARPVEQKKGADKGIDGRIFFHDERESGRTKQIVLSVKAGKLHAAYVRDLRGVVDREKAAIGVLLTMDEPTKPMRAEAATAGFYESPWQTTHPRIQIITVGELLEGKTIDAPPSRDFRTFKKAPKAKGKPQKQNGLFEEGGERTCPKSPRELFQAAGRRKGERLPRTRVTIRQGARNMRIPACWSIPLVLFVLAAPVSAAVDLVTLPTREGTQLTIYNSEDITMVREHRLLTVKEGVNRIQFSWANTLIDPTSIEFRILDQQDKVDLVDTTFPSGRNDALQWNIKSQIAGKIPVEIRYFTSGITWSADYVGIANEDETKLNLTGYVRVTNNSGELYDNAQTRLVVGTINLVEKIADLARRPPPGKWMQLGTENRLRLHKDFDEDIQLAEKATHESVVLADGRLLDQKKRVVKQGLSEYFLFTIEGREDIKDKEPKRLVALNVAEVPLECFYKLTDRGNVSPLPLGEGPGVREGFTKFYRFKNLKLLDPQGKEKKLSDMENLGLSPLPNGAVRLFSEYKTNDLAYVGGTETKYVPIGDRVEVNVGADQDITIHRRLKDQQTGNVVARQYKRRLDNRFVLYYDLVDYDETFLYEEEIVSGKPVVAKTELERQFDADVYLWGPDGKPQGWDGNEPGAYVDLHNVPGRVERVDQNHVKYFLDLPPGKKQLVQYSVTYKRRKVGPELNTERKREPL